MVRSYFAGLISVLLILGIDIQLEMGIAVGVLYIFPLCLSLWCRNRKFLLRIAGFSTLLIIVGFFSSPPGPSPEVWKAIINRVLSVAAVWAFTWSLLNNSHFSRYFDDDDPSDPGDGGFLFLGVQPLKSGRLALVLLGVYR